MIYNILLQVHVNANHLFEGAWYPFQVRLKQILIYFIPLVSPSYYKLTRNKNARHIFSHHFFPVAMIGIICLHMHFVLYTLNTRSIFSNTYTTSGNMTNTAQNARARCALQPRGFSKQKIVFDIGSFIY